ncbi:MAG: hypothetical protein IT366_10990 [Candidatus Hydrogenedentes bacterium]|nr:hypothetical protein [Candidatus Hydrogenedentota bacterium]
MRKVTMSPAFLAAVVGVLAFVVFFGPEQVRAKGKANTRAGVYVIRWDFDKDGSTDLQSFASLLKSGELQMDGPLLPASHAGQGTPRQLGDGRGSWRYLSGSNKYSFSIVFDDTDGSEKVFRLSGRVPAVDEKSFDGNLTLNRFADIDAETAEASQTLGWVGGSDDGSSI